MADLKIQRTVVALTIAIVAIVIAGKTKDWFGPDKVEVINIPQSIDTVFVKNSGFVAPDSDSHRTVENKQFNTNPDYSSEGTNVTQNAKNVEQSTNKYIAEYLVTNSSENQLKDFLEDVKTAIEETGSTVEVNSKDDISIRELSGKYNRFVVVLVKLIFDPSRSTIDSRIISTGYNYSIKLYDVNSNTLISTVHGQDVQPGFNREETTSAIKKRILSHLKEKL